MSSTLLRTKLYISPLRPGLVSRPRLISQLDESLLAGCKLALISAPAGFGKTTLLSGWIHRNKVRAAWVSLDEGDNDPERFWAYVIAALQTVEPTIGQSLLGALQSPQPPPLEALTIALINDLIEQKSGEQHPLLLVLDDYHTITMPEIHRSIDFYLDHLPPWLHLALTTRRDPPLSLPLLRGRRQLIEIRAADLRFTLEETTLLLNNVMELDLVAEDVIALSDRTEGWAVGLQMAALSLKQASPLEQRTFVRAFAGNERLVADYLADEVLGRQPPHIQTFLLQTSILSRLCGPLCDALTGWNESQKILHELERDNLFMVALDHRRHWYRYYQLFADLLRDRLERESTPEQVAALHHRASKWYAAEGLGEDAILHALQAGDGERAADLVEQSGLPALLRGELALVARWLDAIPEDMIRARSMLCIARAWCMLPISIDDALQWIQQAERSTTEGGDYARRRNLVAAHAAALRVAVARTGDAQPSEIVELCQGALERIPSSNAELRALVAFWMGHACLNLGDDMAASQAFELVTQMERDSKSHTTALIMTGLPAWKKLDRGKLHDAAATCRQALHSIVQPAEQAGQRLPMACYIYIVLGQVHLEWNELEKAAQYLERGIKLGELTTVEWPILVDGYCALARLQSIKGDFERALTLIDKAEQTMRLWQGSVGHIPALRVRVWLCQMRIEDEPHYLDRAVAWADGYPLQRAEEYSLELQTAIWVRITQRRTYGAPDLESLFSLLDEQIRLAQNSDYIGWQIETLTLKALALQAQGRTDRAIDLLVDALTLARSERFIQRFLEYGAPMGKLLGRATKRDTVREYAQELLAALAKEKKGEEPTRQALIEPLTPRELEVLALIATGVSNPQIARDLTISVNTVKRHITNIFGKLDVNRRTQAVARGRELGLVD